MGLDLRYANEQLDLWLSADRAVSNAQSYTIGNRTLTRVNASEIRKNIDYWQGKIDSLESQSVTGKRKIYASGVPK